MPRSPVKQLSIDEFLAELKAQGVPRVHLAFVCPVCKTIQSMQSLIDAGAGKTEDDVEPYVGFSCVGRFTGAGPSHKAPRGRGCDWTLGGLFSIHELEVITEDGKKHMRFLPATPEQAQQLMQQKTTIAAVE